MIKYICLIGLNGFTEVKGSCSHNTYVYFYIGFIRLLDSYLYIVVYAAASVKKNIIALIVFIIVFISIGIYLHILIRSEEPLFVKETVWMNKRIVAV